METIAGQEAYLVGFFGLRLGFALPLPFDSTYVGWGGVCSKRHKISSPFFWSLSFGAFVMDPRAIEKADSRLRVARKAVADMKASKTFSEFSDNWYVFLTSAKNIYTVLEQGAKTSPQSRQWFSDKAKFRKSDELLQYLYEARNDDEHGLGSSVEYQAEKHEFGIAAHGRSRSIVTHGKGFEGNVVVGAQRAVVFDGESPPSDFGITPLDGKPTLNKHTAASAILVEVNARGFRKYAPPESHSGSPITNQEPISVAEIAITYLEFLVKEASSLA